MPFKMPVKMLLTVTVAVLALVTLVLFVLCRPSWPRPSTAKAAKAKYSPSWPRPSTAQAAISKHLAGVFANVNEPFIQPNMSLAVLKPEQPNVNTPSSNTL